MTPLALIAEDEAAIAEILDRYLVREGFRTARAQDGQVALDLHALLKPDILLLDVMLPRLDGWAVLGEVRRRGTTPVVMMTALDQDIDKLQGLRMGADDYVVKPFNPVEVVARVQAVLRRTAGLSPDRVIRQGKLEVDPVSYLVSVRGDDGLRPLDLTLTEFRIIEFMARHPRRVFTRGELVDACLPGEEVLERTVDSHMSKLRFKLKAAGLDDVVRGVRGVGYRLDVR
ncbi:response regulator [Caulobacter sp. RHG1]|uniref:response regulator n=1 Tax=Caulobacter sp. (strain RHG1) TaxID=2545762 RepID=UPI0015533667|nr:response regulator [Caulobacter sp. RHG1]NQE64433.1 Two-component transcriptional response regulator, LuxR family [Caulobacter sp. RHG1]